MKSGHNRFEITDLSSTMMAVITTGNGGYEMLDYREVPIPNPGSGEVLLQVLAAGVNNTEINTRLGWYSSSVTVSTDSSSDEQHSNPESVADGGWKGATQFPFIQGTDCCGRVVDIGQGVSKDLLEQRVIVRACIRPDGYNTMHSIWMGSDFDGAFAQYVKVPASQIFAVQSKWSDAALATIPCAYGTAENMLHRAGVKANDRVLVTGASGGVGSATVQLAKRRGAHVTAICSESKMDKVSSIGADVVISRDTDIVEALGESAFNVVIDNVAGPNFPQMLKVLQQGGKYTSSGAIAGPMVNLDMRDMYLKDITLIGCTAWDEPVFQNLISYIENNEIRPLLAKVYPLNEIVEAQQEFMRKEHIGNIVLVPQPISM